MRSAKSRLRSRSLYERLTPASTARASRPIHVSEQAAEAAGDPGPWRQQELLGRDRWDADELRDLVRDYVIEHLGDADAVLVVDETGFLKQGKASCGVARQYTGSAGKITNCQIGVFASYVSRHGHGFIDRALYLPKSWTDDPTRLKATYVPGTVDFTTKPQLATTMIARALPPLCHSDG
jgi:SRSO17 transposase